MGWIRERRGVPKFHVQLSTPRELVSADIGQPKGVVVDTAMLPVDFLAWQPDSQEVAPADEAVPLGPVHEGVSRGPVDERADANVQPVLDQDVHRVLGPDSGGGRMMT